MTADNYRSLPVSARPGRLRERCARLRAPAYADSTSASVRRLDSRSYGAIAKALVSVQLARGVQILAGGTFISVTLGVVDEVGTAQRSVRALGLSRHGHVGFDLLLLHQPSEQRCGPVGSVTDGCSGSMPKRLSTRSIMARIAATSSARLALVASTSITMPAFTSIR